jgi:hypothetical protein
MFQQPFALSRRRPSGRIDVPDHRPVSDNAYQKVSSVPLANNPDRFSSGAQAA